MVRGGLSEKRTFERGQGATPEELEKGTPGRGHCKGKCTEVRQRRVCWRKRRETSGAGEKE